MKKSTFFLPMIILGLFVLTACSDDENDPSTKFDGMYSGTYTSNEGSGNLKATITTGRILFVNTTENITLTGTVSESGAISVNEAGNTVTGTVTLDGIISGSFTAESGQIFGLFSLTKDN